MKILAFSGRKQSGKNSGANWVLGFEMASIGMVHKWYIQSDGQLFVADILGDTAHAGIFDNFNRDKEAIRFMESMIWPYVKIYSFADLLKQLCIDIFGLSYAQVYGSDDDKNTETKLRWENMPIPPDVVKLAPKRKEALARSGIMTARDVLEYVGTDIFRQIYADVWAEALINKIKSDQCEFAVICDLRFPNEVIAVKNAGGKVIRLTRKGDVFSDKPSEVSLDKDRYDWNNFDYVLDNKDMTISEQSKCIFDKLIEWKWILNPGKN